MNDKAFQDYYSEDVSICYGCGRLNDHGLQLKSYWDGEEATCTFRPQAYHTAVPGYVYGGLIASIIDCHSTGTAAATAYRAAGREMGTEPPFRYITASLHVDYLQPTPINQTLIARARVKEFVGRRVVVTCSLFADELECARGEVVVVRMPDAWLT